MRRIRSVPYVDISLRYEIVFCEVAQVTSHNKADRKNSQTYIPVRASPIPGLTYAYIENITAQGGSCNVTYRRLLRTS